MSKYGWNQDYHELDSETILLHNQELDILFAKKKNEEIAQNFLADHSVSFEQEGAIILIILAYTLEGTTLRKAQGTRPLEGRSRYV